VATTDAAIADTVANAIRALNGEPVVIGDVDAAVRECRLAPVDLMIVDCMRDEAQQPILELWSEGPPVFVRIALIYGQDTSQLRFMNAVSYSLATPCNPEKIRDFVRFCMDTPVASRRHSFHG
jgi:hypothetical protein